jgi:hypothetical protein
VIMAVNLLAVYEHDALSHHPVGMDQSLRGHTATRVVARLPTVLSSSLVLRRSEFTVIAGTCNLPWCFHHVTPYVEVPNLPVDVDSWGR